MVKISEVLRGSVSEKMGIRAGQYLKEINGQAIKDVLDYRFYLTDKKKNATQNNDEAVIDE